MRKLDPRATNKRQTNKGESIIECKYAFKYIGVLRPTAGPINMKFAFCAVSLCFAAFAATSVDRPRAGKTEILKLSEVRPGMKGVAWTTFQGVAPEPVPIELIGISKNA